MLQRSPSDLWHCCEELWKKDANKGYDSFFKTDPEILPIAIGTPDNPARRQAGIEHFFIEIYAQRGYGHLEIN